jgi:tyrosinase
MGENNTASFDPIFYFHHAYIDYVFWVWQQLHSRNDDLGTIIPEYPGTNSVDGQGPTPGVVPNSWLSLESPLSPFMLTKDGQTRPYTSLDCVNTEKSLGYTYGPGSLSGRFDPRPTAELALTGPGRSTRSLSVSGFSRGSVAGSFLVSAFATVAGRTYHIGTEAVLSRWNVQNCANCQMHLDTKCNFSLHRFPPRAIEDASFSVQVTSRDYTLAVGSHEPKERAERPILAAVQPLLPLKSADTTKALIVKLV